MPQEKLTCAPACSGNQATHCCVFRNVDCPFVEENTVEGRRWVCGLLRELGSWDDVLADKRYKTTVQDLYNSVPELKGKNCRDWFCEGLTSGDAS